MTTEQTQTGDTGAAPPADETTVGGGEDAGGGESEASEEVVSFARQNGWSPKDEWRGDPDKWEDASAFADRASKINPILKTHNESLKRQLTEATNQIAQAQRDAKEAVRMVRETAKREYDAALASLKKERIAAISDGDGERVAEIEGRMESLEPPVVPKEEPAPRTQQVPANVLAAGEAFGAKYDFMGGETPDAIRKQRVVSTIAAELRAAEPGLVHNPQFFSRIEQVMQQDYPELFRKKTTPSMSDGGGAPGGGARNGVKRGFEQLPKDAREQALRFEGNGTISKEDYAKQYWIDHDAGRQ